MFKLKCISKSKTTLSNYYGIELFLIHSVGYQIVQEESTEKIVIEFVFIKYLYDLNLTLVFLDFFQELYEKISNEVVVWVLFK